MLGNSVRPIEKGLLAEAVILISSVRPLVWNLLIMRVFLSRQGVVGVGCCQEHEHGPHRGHSGEAPKIVMPDIVFR